MMKRLFIHTGTPKTGTSSFQRFLLQNAAKLTERGLTPMPAGMGRGGGHPALVRALFHDSREKPWSEIRSEFWQTLKQSPDQDFIVSTEAFVEGGLRLDPQRRIMNYLRRRARETNHEIVFVVCIRHVPMVFESSYAQRAKTFQATNSFHRQAQNYLRHPNYFANQVVPVRETGAPALYIPFNGQTRKLGVERTLLQALGIGFDDLELPDPVNERPGICQVAACLALSERLLKTRSINVLQAARCGQIVEAECAKALDDDPRYRPMTTDVASRIEAATQEQREEFSSSVWGKPWAEVFPEDTGCRFEPMTIDRSDNPARYRSVVRSIIEAAQPKVQEAIDDEEFRQRTAFSRETGSRTTLIGCDIY